MPPAINERLDRQRNRNRKRTACVLSFDAAAKIAELQAAIERVIRGKSETVKFALVALFAKGHLLIEDVPGIGKTTLANALGRAL